MRPKSCCRLTAARQDRGKSFRSGSRSEFGFPRRTFLPAEHSRFVGHPGQLDIVHFQIPDIAEDNGIAVFDDPGDVLQRDIVQSDRCGGDQMNRQAAADAEIPE